MDKKYKKQIDRILSDFDFNFCSHTLWKMPGQHRFMHCELKNGAKLLLQYVAKHGGVAKWYNLMAYRSKGQLLLTCVIETSEVKPSII